MSFILSNLTSYVDANSLDIKIQLLEGMSTVQHIMNDNGIHDRKEWKMLGGDVINITNAECYHPGNNSTTLLEKNIEVFMCNYSENLCPSDLAKYSWQQFLNPNKENLNDDLGGIQEAFVTYKTGLYGQWLENQIWQGTTGLQVTPGVHTNYAKGGFPGFLTKFESDSDVINTVTFDFSDHTQTPSTYIGKLLDVYNSLPNEVKTQKDLKVFMSVGDYAIYLQKLMMNGNAIIRSENITKFGSIESAGTALIGTTAVVVPVSGLPAGRVVCTPGNNLVLGSDLMTKKDNIGFYYNPGDDFLRVRIKGKFGVQYYFGGYVSTNSIA